jgi:hypothetical protein
MGTGTARSNTAAKSSFPPAASVRDLSGRNGITTPHSQLRQVIFTFPVDLSLTRRPLHHAWRVSSRFFDPKVTGCVKSLPGALGEVGAAYIRPTR